MRRWLPPGRSRTLGRGAAVRCEYGGHSYASKAEMRYARDLDLRLAVGEIIGWLPQWRIRFEAPSGELVWVHVVDFRIEHRDGSVEFVEVKGHAEDDWKLKSKVLAKIIVPAMNTQRPTRYTIVTPGGLPWEPAKRPKTPKAALHGSRPRLDQIRYGPTTK